MERYKDPGNSLAFFSSGQHNHPFLELLTSSPYLAPGHLIFWPGTKSHCSKSMVQSPPSPHYQIRADNREKNENNTLMQLQCKMTEQHTDTCQNTNTTDPWGKKSHNHYTKTKISKMIKANLLGGRREEPGQPLESGEVPPPSLLASQSSWQHRRNPAILF